MSDRKWFLLADSQVSGPFSKDDLPSRASPLKDPLVWGRGSSEWVAMDKWDRIVKDLEALDAKPKSSVDRQWKVRNAGVEQKLMSHDQMISYLRTQKDFAEVQIWTDGYTEWKDIYQIHKIMDELGVSRRKHPRVPIMGTLTCEGATGTFNARVLSISEGGLGITECPNVKIGEKFKTVLKSPNLYAPVHATTEVVYVGLENYAGLKFIGLHPESKSAVIEYVKKFTSVDASS